jgi:signal peptidase I
MKLKRWLSIAFILVCVGVLVPSYVRAYRVAGASDAPSYLVGDRILVNKAAYDIRLPYSGVVVVSHSEPDLGDVVLYRSPRNDGLVFKRVVGRPGDMVSMQENHLTINGKALRYAAVDDAAHASVADANLLGSAIEIEAGHGPEHAITYTPGAGPLASFAPVRVPDRHYYMIGDNRDHSEDSRSYGPVSRDRILGKVGFKLTSAR